MLLEIHPWIPSSPASSPSNLPTIHPESLATILLLRSHLDPSTSRLQIRYSRSLNHPSPTLHHANQQLTSLRSITTCLHTLSPSTLLQRPDANLSATDAALGLVHVAHLQLHLAPLLDMALYADWTNWACVVRPVLAQAVGGAARYVDVPRKRGRVLTRVGERRAGLVEGEDGGGEREGEGQVGRGELLKGLQRAGRGRLGRRIKEEEEAGERRKVLGEMVLEALEPLHKMLLEKGQLQEEQGEGEKSTGPLSTLECVATGYLAVIMGLALPNSWLRDEVRKSFPKLDAWHTKLLHRAICACNSPSQCTAQITVEAAPTQSILQNLQAFGTACVPDAARAWFEGEEMRDEKYPGMDGRLVRGGGLAAGLSVVVLGWLLVAGRVGVPAWVKMGVTRRGGEMLFGRRSLAGMGEAGKLLAAL